MEDPFDKLSNQYKTLFYAVRLKVADTAQTLRTMGSKLTENQIKTFTSQQMNVFNMTQKMFNQFGSNHLYKVLKLMNANMNSLVVILIERVQKLTQKLSMSFKSLNDQHQNCGSKHEGPQLAEKDSVFVQTKRNKLGGIQIFNENYARYLQDHRILEQIKYQKQQRILKKRNEILSSMIYNQLNHKTDVQGEATPNDDIAKYIIQSRKIGSIYNYVPYQQELQEILVFFQNSQAQANNFLIKKENADVHQVGSKFSFADFQREIKLKNTQFQKKVMEKLINALKKLREKQKRMQQSFLERQEHLKLMQKKKQKGQQKQIQTQFQFNQFIKQHQNGMRDLQFKCQILQSHRVQQVVYIQRQNQLNYEISLKVLQIQKLETKLKDFQTVIISLKKMIRQDKSKKWIIVKEQQSQKNQFVENGQKLGSKKQKQSRSGSQLAIAAEDCLSLNSNNALRKTSNKSYHWNRKLFHDDTSLMSVNLSQNQQNEREQLSRTLGKKFVKYNTQSFRSNQQDQQIHKPKGTSLKFNRQTKSKQSAIQTQMKEEFQNQQLNQSSKAITIVQEQQNVVDQRTTTKSSRLKFQGETLESNITSLSNIQKQQQNNREKSQNKKNSSKLKIDTKYNSKQMKQKAKDLKEKLEQPVKRQSETIENQEIVKKTIVSSILKNTSKLDELMISKKKNEEKKLAKELISQEGKQLKPQTQLMEAKDQNLYKMFEVVQEEGQQEKQSIRNTKRSSLVDMIKSPIKGLEYESLQKLSKQFKKIKAEKNCFYQQLYSFTIKPFKNLQKTISLPNFSKDIKKINSAHESSQKMDLSKKFRNSTETSEVIMIENQNTASNILQVFDKVQKHKACGDRNTQKKLKDWKKIIQNSYKSNLMSLFDVQNIASVLRISSNKFNNVFQNKINSATNNVDCTQKKVALDLQDNTISCNQAKNKHSNFRHNSLTNPFDQQICKNIQAKLKLQQLITFQALHEDFPSKFEKLHKNCKQGAICSHITKYFEILMKHIGQIRQKQKSLLSLHIQTIGNRISTDNYISEKKAFKTQQNTYIQSKQPAFSNACQIQNRYQGKSLRKMKKSKLSLLPSIKEPRKSLYSSTK